MATNSPIPYITQNPGDLITAENWNQVQVDVQMDIAAQIQTAVGNIKSVDHATDADQLGGQTPDQLTQAILKQAEEILPQRTGYLRSFNRLETQKEKVIKHGLKSFPLVDVYQLDYFPAICSNGENDNTPRWVNFFLYHTKEATISIKVGTTTVKAVIEAPDEMAFKVPFSDMLALYKVQPTDDETLEDVETEFWKAFWAKPNDQFDGDQYGHSPWFEKCCGEQRTFKSLQKDRRGDWDDIWFKMVPRKTLNYPTPPGATLASPGPNVPFDGSVAPTQIQVVHHDFDNVGIKLLLNPVYPPTFVGTTFELPEGLNELKVMVLMKV